MIKTILITLLFILNTSFASIRDYSTTRMISTSGAGVGSMNTIDATTLNPAMSAFYSGSLFYAQTTRSSFESDDPTLKDQAPKGIMLAMSDSAKISPGGLMFQKYKEQDTERMRFGFNMGKRFAKYSAFGLGYQYTIDETPGRAKDKYHQANLGFAHVFSRNISTGLTVNNLNNNEQSDSRGTLGTQFAFSRSIVILADGGFDYRSSFEKTKFYKLGAQLRFFKDFVLRGGLHDDAITNTKGKSAGIGWIAPKMTLEVGYQQSEVADTSLVSFIENGDKLKELTASLIIKLK